MPETPIVLILGSAPSAPECAGWDWPGPVVAINSAWQVRLDWDRALEGVDLTAAEPGGAVAAGSVQHEDGTPCPECSVVVFGVDGLPAAMGCSPLPCLPPVPTALMVMCCQPRFLPLPTGFPARRSGVADH